MEISKSSDFDRKNISFKLNKVSKTLIESSFSEVTETDFVTSVDKAEIKSTLSKPPTKDLVIPLIKKNNWRVSKPINSNLTQEEKQIKDIAIQELLKECSEKNAEWEQRSSSEIAAIPLMMQNKVPEGYETDDKMDVSLRPDESSIEDYDRVPIEQFGLALLRGMGWKEGGSIGGKTASCVKPIEVQLRPKGLGLGADASVLKKITTSSKKEKLILVKGAYVHIIHGALKGFYGEVIGLDDDNARVMVKVMVSGEEQVKTFPEFFTNVVTKKEYDKESRILNRASYEQYKKENEVKEKGDQRNRNKETSDPLAFPKDSSRKYKEKTLKNSDSKRRKHSTERSMENQESLKVSKYGKNWVKPQLKVRLIDEKYKKGKYFNTKVTVVDVLSRDSCSCKTEDHKYLDDISPSMLETVIPRHEDAYVMIVQGKHKGELCTILKRDKASCIATVQFLSDRRHAVQIDYDSICEYVGEVDQFD